MTEEFSGHNSSGLPDEDKMGFAVPKTPMGEKSSMTGLEKPVKL